MKKKLTKKELTQLQKDVYEENQKQVKKSKKYKPVIFRTFEELKEFYREDGE